MVPVSNPMRQDSWPPGEACKSLAFIQQLPHMVIPCECSYAAISVYLCSFAAAANVNFSANDSCCMVQMQYSHFLSHSVCYLDFKTQIHLSRVRYVSKCIVSAIAFQAPSLLSLVLVQRRLLCMFTALHHNFPLHLIPLQLDSRLATVGQNHLHLRFPAVFQKCNDGYSLDEAS